MGKCVFCEALDKHLKEKNAWHPTIDYIKCTGCLACFNFCKNGVYQINEESKPFVAKPENCVPGCRGCEKTCSVQAITH